MSSSRKLLKTFELTKKILITKFKIVKLPAQNRNCLNLDSKICENYSRICGKTVTEDGWLGLSGLNFAGRFFRHSNKIVSFE